MVNRGSVERSASVFDEPGRPSDAGAPQPHLPELTWPAWVFIGGAVVVVLVHLSHVGQEPGGLLVASAVLSALVAGLGALLPAALLVRIPEAPRTQRLLLAGLAGQAVAVWGWAIFPVLLTGPARPDWSATAAFAILYGAAVVASICLAVGLLRLRRPGVRRVWLLAVIAVLQLGFTVVQAALPAATVHLSFVSPMLVPIAVLTVAAAFAAWVPVDAWLGRERPRPFWALLALGFPLGLVAGALGVWKTLEMLRPSGTGLTADTPFWVASMLVSLIGIAANVLALAAYARLTPIPEV